MRCCCMQECRVGVPGPVDQPIWLPGVAPHVYDEAGQKQLWALSKRLTGPQPEP